MECCIQYGIEPTEVYHGTVIQYDFDAESTYRFIITSLKSATTTLDFVKLTPVFPGSVVTATRRVIGDFEAMEVVDRGAGSMSGGGAVTVAASVPFNLPFSDAPNVFAQATHCDLNASVKNVTSSGFTIEVTHVRGVAWTGTYTIYWVAFGGVTRPYAPGLPL